MVVRWVACLVCLAGFAVPCSGVSWSGFAREMARDTVCTHRELASEATVCVAGVGAVWYGVTRCADDGVHRHFYDEACHKDRHARARDTWLEESVAPVVASGALLTRSADPHVALVGRVYLANLFPIWCGKRFLKSTEYECNKRPACGRFPRRDDVYGGFPSGHTAYAAYCATLFGLEFGPAVGVPLGAYAGAVAGASISTNRHFTSQVVAGAALGVAYGIAAHKVIDAYTFHVCDGCQRRFEIAPAGGGAEIAYRF